MNSPLDESFKNFLSSTARKERTMLLISAAIGIAVADVGLIPTKIPAFGIEFTTSNRSQLLILLAFVILYFGFGFTSHFLADFLAWKSRISSSRISAMSNISLSNLDNLPVTGPGTDQRRKIVEGLRERELEKFNKTFSQFKLAGLLRIIYDIAIPISLGIYAFYRLFFIAKQMASQ